MRLLILVAEGTLLHNGVAQQILDVEHFDENQHDSHQGRGHEQAHKAKEQPQQQLRHSPLRICRPQG